MIKLTLDFLKIFDKKLTTGFTVIILGSVISGILELFGMMLIIPFIQVSMDPSFVERNTTLLYIFNFLNLTEYKSMIYIVGVFCGLSFIIKDLFMLAFQNYQFRLVTDWRNELSEKFMRLYLGLNYRFHLRQASSAVINTLTSTISSAINGFLLQILFLISYSIVALCLLGFMLYSYLVVTLTTAFILCGVIYFQAKLQRKESKKINNESIKNKEANLVSLKQSIEAIKETKMFLKEEYFEHLFLKSNRRVTDVERRANLLQYMPIYLTEIVIIFCVILIVCMMTFFQKENGQAFAGLAILIAIIFRLSPVINRIMFSYSQIKMSQQAIVFLNREYSEIILQQDLIKDSLERSEFAIRSKIELKNVTFAYNEVDVLLDISLEIRKGEFVGIVGHSGCGKTTLVDVLMGLFKVKSGEYLLDGIQISEEMLRGLRRSIGYVPQNPFISDTSIASNIAFGDAPESFDYGRIKNVLKSVDLYDFFIEKPEGLDFRLGENGKRLSGGQRQRVAIARAMYNDPEIIVFDEATSALDVKSENEISNAIGNLKGKVTIIAIAHRLSTLRKADRIVLMNRGKIVANGSFKELVENNLEFANLVELSRL